MPTTESDGFARQKNTHNTMPEVDLGQTTDLTTVDTSTPLLKDGEYEVTIYKMDLVTTKTAPPRPMLKIEAKLVEGGEDQNGGRLYPGFPIFDNIMLVDEEQPDRVAKRCAVLQECFLGERRVKFNTDDFIGQSGVVRIKTEPAKGAFPASNRVARYEAKK